MSKISPETEQRIRWAAKHRCGYCLVPQKLVSYRLELEHLFPKAKDGETEEKKLWLACRQCNLSKGIKTEDFDSLTFEQVRLFNPREQVWSEHFLWREDNTLIVGKTPCGRATVSALQLNSDLQKTAREFWKLTGIFPPKD